jgi:group I intron endonuclease
MKRKGLIYKATDDVLNRSYIGQTLGSLEQRKKEHLKSANWKVASTYFTIFYKMLRFLGSDHFKWEILEDNIPLNLLDAKEAFYIKKFDTYNNGYNSTYGGQKESSKGSRILSEKEAEEIQQLLKNSSLSIKEIANKFPGCTRETVSDINCGETWRSSEIEYPIRKSFNKKINFDENSINEIVKLLKDTNLTYKDIASKFSCHPFTIKKINNGDCYPLKGVEYPIREKCFAHLSDGTARLIANDLLNCANMNQQEIANKYNVRLKQVSCINTGKYHRESLKDFRFPIRPDKRLDQGVL